MLVGFAGGDEESGLAYGRDYNDLMNAGRFLKIIGEILSSLVYFLFVVCLKLKSKLQLGRDRYLFICPYRCGQ